MKVVLQCCTSGSVTIDGEVNGSVGRGYVALVGITTRDTQAEARLLAEKCVALRVFADDGGKLNLSVKDIGGEMFGRLQRIVGEYKKNPEDGGLRVSFLPRAWTVLPRKSGKKRWSWG